MCAIPSNCCHPWEGGGAILLLLFLPSFLFFLPPSLSFPVILWATGSESLSHLIKVTQQGNGKAMIEN